MEGFKVFKEGENEKDLKKLVKGTFTGKYGGFDDENKRQENISQMDITNRKNILKFSELQNKLYDITTQLSVFESTLNNLEEKNQKFQELNRKNFQVLTNIDSNFDLPKTDIEKDIDNLSIQISSIQDKIKKENINEESINALRQEYEKLKIRYDNISGLIAKKNPSLN